MTVTVEEAQSRLKDLIAQIPPGEECLIVDGQRSIARLVVDQAEPEPRPRQPGSARDKILYMAQDFNGPMEEFKEYME